MSIDTPNGILDITNAIVRVSKMEFQQATGFDTVLNNIARNTILLSDSATYETASTYHNWALKLPNAWVFEADVFFQSGTPGVAAKLNFYNNVNTAITNGYTLELDGTSLVLKYDGTQISTATLSTTLNDDAWHKLFVLFERDTFAVAIDGKAEYTFTDSVLRDRVYNDDTGYVVFYHESGTYARKIKNLKFVNGDKWLRESGSSNIAYVGGSVGVGTDAPAYTLDINGDINFSGNVYQGASPFISSLWTDGESSLYYRSNVEVGTANLFVDVSTSNVGIGTDTPLATLDVRGDANVGTLTSTGIYGEIVGSNAVGASTGTFSGDLQVGTANLFVDVSTSSVGIGTANPSGTLHVHSTDSIIVPSGTTAQRSQTPVNGMLRYNSETGYFETYTVSGWGSLATPPSITSFTPTAVDTGTSSGTQITVTGSFFDQNSSIKLRGSDGTEYSTTSFSFTSTTSISATLPLLPVAKSPYTVVVTAGSGLSTESTDTLVSGNTPVWSSPAAGANVSSSSTITLSATDADGDSLTYSIVSGTLPGGLTLSGNQISGTSTATAGSTSTITVRASDGELYADRTFNIETPLYAFTSHTFTNAGATGRTGPTLTQCRNAYNVTWDGDTSLFNVVTQGIQEWTVPESGTYRITAAGAGGSTQARITSAGSGFIVRADVELTGGQVLSIVCGQVGLPTTQSSTASWKSGGGGASWVYISGDYQPILVGGGGGGGAEGGSISHGVGYNSGYSNYSWRNGSAVQRNTSIGQGGPAGNLHQGIASGAGGAGWFSDGAESTYNRQGLYDGRGKTRANGFVGGTASNYDADGGFGGGAAGMDNTGTGGGGGGYTGGPGGDDFNPWGSGGGGSSYLTGQNQVEVGVQSSAQDYGYVTITKL